MFFDDISEIPVIASKESVCIFTAEPNSEKLRPYFTIAPGKNGKITIDQVRELIAATQTKQSKDQYILIKNAESIEPAAENAILKLLEEPKDFYHFILITREPHALLPTILSRAKLYIKKEPDCVSVPPAVDQKALELAKKLLTTTPRDLPNLADQLGKNTREEVLQIISTAIELAYKSYFATGKPVFLKKLPKLLKLYQNIKGNGHLKLHIVADML